MKKRTTTFMALLLAIGALLFLLHAEPLIQVLYCFVYAGTIVIVALLFIVSM